MVNYIKTRENNNGETIEKIKTLSYKKNNGCNENTIKNTETQVHVDRITYTYRLLKKNKSLVRKIKYIFKSQMYLSEKGTLHVEKTLNPKYKEKRVNILNMWNGNVNRLINIIRISEKVLQMNKIYYSKYFSLIYKR